MESMNSRNIWRTLLIGLLVIAITILHYRTEHLQVASHIIFRELYFLPIVLAAFWFGTKGALATSLAITLFYLPYLLVDLDGISGHNFGNVIQVLLFNLFAFLLGLLRDREKKLQRRAREAENLAAMGRAVSCIAHDMKTPLMTIGGFVRQVRRKLDNDRLAEKLDFAAGQVQRLEMLVGDMLAFARPLKLQCREERIDRLIEEAVMLTGEKASRLGITVETDVQGNIPAAPFDRQRLQQALLNLINNALEASPAGERVTISCRCGKEGLIIEITDRGQGIPKQRMADLFTPFVTTKTEGTGLGLPIVKKVIEAHAGAIDIRNNPDKGVTFRVVLPLHLPCDIAE